MDLVAKTEDAYSFSRYGSVGWRKCVSVLQEYGFDENEIEWVLFSKHMRWAADLCGPTAEGLKQYLSGSIEHVRQDAKARQFGISF